MPMPSTDSVKVAVRVRPELVQAGVSIWGERFATGPKKT